MATNRPTPTSASKSSALLWPQDPGLFSSTSSPQLSPTSLKEWAQFVTTSRSQPLWHRFGGNFRAAATVALVSVPLSISLAIACGGTPEQGIITQFWGGLISSIFGGSHFNIVGPTGALSGLLSILSNKHGSEVLPYAAVYASFFLFLFLIFRFDRIIRYIPVSVGHGFAVGVALPLAIGRLGVGLGLRHLPPSSSFFGKLFTVLRNSPNCRPLDALYFFSHTILLFQCQKRWHQIPWMIVFPAFGIWIGMHIDGFTLLKADFPDITPTLVNPLPVVSNILAGNGFRQLPELSYHLLDQDLIFYSLGTAVVSLLESLIAARIANAMIEGDDAEIVKRSYSSKRETFGLALSNLFVGGFGGLPATAALSRTALNVRSGAYNRVATFMGTIILGAVSMSALGYFIYIPASTIASILVVNAYKMINFKEIARIYRADKKSAFAILFTAYASLTLDTFSGLLVGSLSLFLIHFDSFGKLKCSTDETTDRRKLMVRIECPIVFVNISELERYLQTLVIDLSLANNHHEGAEAALDLCAGSPAAGIRALSSSKASFATQADAVPTQPPPPALRRMQIDLARCTDIDFDGMDLLARSVETISGMGLFVDVSIVNHEHLGPEVLEVLARGPIRHGR